MDYRQDLQEFSSARLAGAIDGRGNPVEANNRCTLRARPVEADIDWLRWLCNWAMSWQDEQGRLLMRETPVRGFEAPTQNTLGARWPRPIATERCAPWPAR